MAVINNPEQDKVSRLIANLKHETYSVRLEAIDSLGESKDVRAIEALIDLLGEHIFPGRLVSKVKFRASVALSNIGQKAVPALINALADAQSNPERSYWVIVALGLIKDNRAVAPLINILDNESLINTPYLPYHGIRKSAIEALGRIGDPEAIEPLGSIFNIHGHLSGYWAVTIEALERLGGKRALEVLQEASGKLPLGSGYDNEFSNVIKRMQAEQSSTE